MGSLISRVSSRSDRKGKKRKWTWSFDADKDEESQEEFLDRLIHTAKRRKLTSTSDYIHKALFIEGNSSDVTLLTLGKEWHLHKIYLCQSPYFASMFCGSWKEAAEKVIPIEILDPNITLDAIRTVFGCLYFSEINIEPADAVSVLATATMFQMEGIIDQATSVMNDAINNQTVFIYYSASVDYGIPHLKDNCFNWLLANLTCYLPDQPKLLRQISPELMHDLVASARLFVQASEFAVYVLLKLWIYLRLHPAWEGPTTSSIIEACKYFNSREECQPFVTTDIGQPYITVFRRLRFPYLMMHYSDLQSLEVDRIVPKEWIEPVFRDILMHTLQIDSGIDKGPKELSTEDFDQNCLRCGRTLSSENQQLWHWTGYHFGLDLVMTYELGNIKLKRSHRQEHESLLSLQSRRHVMVRVTAMTMNEQRQAVTVDSSDIKCLTFTKNEEVTILSIENPSFPMLISCNLMLVTPFKSSNSISVPLSPQRCFSPSPDVT